MYRSFSYVFGLGALLMLAACGDGEKKSETKEQKASSATETTEKAEQVSEEGSGKIIPISETNSKSGSEDVAETKKPIKTLPKRTPKVLTNDTNSLVDIIESPIDDIVVDEPDVSEEKLVDQGQNIAEEQKLQSDQEKVVTAPTEAHLDQEKIVAAPTEAQLDQEKIVAESTEVQSDQEKVVTENDVSEAEGRKSDSDNSPVYELDNSNESAAVENSEVSDNAEVVTNSKVPEISEEIMEGEFSNAEPSVNESVDEEDFVM